MVKNITIRVSSVLTMAGALVFDRDPRSIGFIEESEDREVYYPVILFNFTVLR